MTRTLLIIFAQFCLMSAANGFQAGFSDQSITPSPSVAAQPESITLPAGTEISIRTAGAINSKKADTSTEYPASVDDAVSVNGLVVVPAKANAWLKVTALNNPRIHRASLSTTLVAVTGTTGRRVEVVTGDLDSEAVSHVKRTLAEAGAGAGVGAAIGSVGGAMGAGIGAAAGATAGVVVGVVTAHKDGVSIPAETRYTYRLLQPVTIDYQSPGPQPISRNDGGADAASPRGVPLESQLAARYKPTTLTADYKDLVTPGSVLILQKRGFSGGVIANPLVSKNTYTDGRIKPDAADVARKSASKATEIARRIPWLKNSADSADKATSQAGTAREFMNGEKLYVTVIRVDRSKDAIVFNLISDPVGNDGRYRGSLAFQYRQGSLASADLSTVQPMIEEVFATEPSQDAGPAVAPDKPLPPDTPPVVITLDKPLPPVAPPPPLAPDLPPPTQVDLNIGQTAADVEATLGPPVKIIRVSGAKEIYQYKDLKVTFVNGKVTDVE